MSGKTKGGIVCIIIGGLIGLLFINDSSKNDAREELINNVVFIENINQISDANEGKAIIVTGHPELPKDAVDPKNNIHAKAPYLKRIDQTYSWKHCSNSYSSNNDDYCMQWSSSGTGEEFKVDATIGKYHIPCDSLLSLNMPQKPLPLAQTDADRLNMKIDTDEKAQYFTNSPGLRTTFRRGNSGATRTGYVYKDLSEYDVITVLGIQEKGAIITNDVFHAKSFDHALTRDEVIASYKDDQKTGLLTGMIIMILLFVIGGALVYFGKKENKESAA